MPVYVPPVNETTSPYQFDSVVTIGGGAVSGGPLGPQQVGLKTWNFPIQQATGTGTSAPSAGSIMMSAINLVANQTYSNIYVNVLTAIGTGVAAGSNYAGVYNSAGTLVATTGSAAIDSVIGTSGGAGFKGVLAFPLSAAYTPASSGQYYVGMFFTGSAGSLPVLATAAGATAANSITAFVGSYYPFEVGPGTPASAAPYMFSAIATTSGSALPTSFTLANAGTTGAYPFWCGMA